MKAILKLKNKKIEILGIKKCQGINQVIGLMFKQKGTNALLFEFKKPTNQAIHSFFCPCFLAIWLDEKNNVLEYRLIASKKTNIKPKKQFSKLLELPLNKNYNNIIQILLANKKV